MIEPQQCGFISSYIKSIIPELNNASGYDNLIVLRDLSSFEVEEIASVETNTIFTEKEKQLIFVLDNLLSRGFPTLCSIFLERQLFNSVTEEIKIQEFVSQGNIRYSDSIVNSASRHKWVNVLIDALLFSDSNFDPNVVFDDVERIYNTQNNISVSQEERMFYCKILPEMIGLKISQLFEPQRKIETMLPSDIIHNYFGQRVDFALETVDSKIVIEIDGNQHLANPQLQQDTQRRSALRNNGWTVIEITANEIRVGLTIGNEQAIKAIITNSNYLKRLNDDTNNEYSKCAKDIIQIPFYVARFQKCLLMALKRGRLLLDNTKWNLCIVEENIPFAELAVGDFKEWLNHFCSLYNLSLPVIEFRTLKSFKEINPNANDEIIFWISLKKKWSTTEKQVLQQSATDNNLFLVTSTFHTNNEYKINSTNPFRYEITEKQEHPLLFLLQSIFRKEKFWEAQLEILRRSLALKPVIGLLPTGAGKSLTYQLSALLQPGVTLVVDPLRSLMFDQADNMRNYCIENIEFLNSEQTASQRAQVINAMANGRYQLIFIAPERLQDNNFRNSLTQMTVTFSVPYLVIDEAHCVSEWGHDFRTSYLNLAKTAKKYCVYQNYTPTILALTGTASYSVLTDVQREIGIDEEEAKIYPQSFERKELIFDLWDTPSANKLNILTGLMQNHLPTLFNSNRNRFFEPNSEDTFSGLIFVSWTNNTFGSQVRDNLQNNLHILIGFYSGSIPNFFEPNANQIERSKQWNNEKRRIQNDFKNNKFPVLVSTKAFGMGIDKPNVRYTIHFGIPSSLEAFYQEAGRAGRDKNSSYCLIIFSDDNPTISDQYLDINLSAQQLSEMKRNGIWPAFGQDGDIHRMLHFHLESFKGVTFEINLLQHLLQENVYIKYNHLSIHQTESIIIPFQNKDGKDKAVYRLTILGLIDDYTVNHKTPKHFNAIIKKLTDDEYLDNLKAYLSRYKTPDHIRNAITELHNANGANMLEKCLGYIVRFAYSEIEKKRRSAIWNMLEVARGASIRNENKRDDYIREQLLAYLEKSIFTDLLLEMVQSDEHLKWWTILEMVNDINLARQLLGGCRKIIEDKPEYPGLYILRAFSRLLLPNPNIELTNGDFITGIKLIRSQYKIEIQEEIIINIIDFYQSKIGQLNEVFGKMLLDLIPSRKIARLLFTSLPKQSQTILLSILLENTKNYNKHYIGD